MSEWKCGQATVGGFYCINGSTCEHHPKYWYLLNYADYFYVIAYCEEHKLNLNSPEFQLEWKIISEQQANALELLYK